MKLVRSCRPSRSTLSLVRLRTLVQSSSVARAVGCSAAKVSDSRPLPQATSRISRLSLLTPPPEKLGDHLRGRDSQARAGGRERLPELMLGCLGVLFKHGAAVAHHLGQTLMAAPCQGGAKMLSNPPR